MSSPSSAVAGVRKPRFSHVRPAVSSGAAEAIPFAAEAGLELDPWQQDVLMAGLGERSDGRCASFTVGLVVPRQNGKNAILEAAELYWLFLDDTVRLITHTAHRFDTSLEHFGRLRQLVEDTPDLIRQVRKIFDTNGKESIRLKNGKRIDFKTRGSKGNGRGFSADRTVLDEALWLGKLSGLIPAMSARANPQLWYTSSAPEDGPASDQLRSIIRRGRAGDDDLTYFEWTADPDADLDDPTALAQANPALGIRLDLGYIYGVERKELPDDEFARERLGIFSELQDGEPPKLEPRHWKLCLTKEKHPDRKGSRRWMRNPVSFGVAVTPDREWATIAAAGACREGGVAIEVVEHRPGVDWLPARLAELRRTHKPKAIAIDPRGPAGSLIDDIVKAGVPAKSIRECNTADHQKAAAQFYDGVRYHTIVHRGSPELDAAAAKAVARPVGEAWLFDRRGPVPISPLEATELAAWAHNTTRTVDPADQVF